MENTEENLSIEELEEETDDKLDVLLGLLIKKTS